jgi:hypothetical protein
MKKIVKIAATVWIVLMAIFVCGGVLDYPYRSMPLMLAAVITLIVGVAVVEILFVWMTWK